jgi:hypothetical protein
MVPLIGGSSLYLHKGIQTPLTLDQRRTRAPTHRMGALAEESNDEGQEIHGNSAGICVRAL